MTARALVLTCVTLSACETPPLTLRIALTDGDSQQCIGDTGVETLSCSDITVECTPVLSIRIVPPSAPEIPYVSVCKELPSARKLCSIAGVDLPQPSKPIPEQVLEVQMAVFPRDAVTVDTDGTLVCPRVEFGVNGLPVTAVDCIAADDPASCAARPAIGGRAFYYPGDEETVVALGCTELELLRGEQCTGANRTEVIATVNEFEYPGSVDPATANRLFVSVGEPVPAGPSNYVLDSVNTRQLPRDTSAALPSWTSTFLDFHLSASYCIEVLEDAPMATRTVTCRALSAPDPGRVDSTGVRLKPETLTTILKALYSGNTTFPPQGLVVGIVLNQFFAPVAGATVVPSCATASPACTVEYLSEDRMSFSSIGGTSSNGIWVSTDAPYASTFSWQGQVSQSFGGLIDNKVTIVVLQESAVVGN